LFFQDKSFEAAIFDMDGTMFDTERLRFTSIKQASKEIFGEEISDQILYDSLGVSAVTAEKIAKQRYGTDYPYKEIRALADKLERGFVREHGIPVKEGLYNLLERLKKNGSLIALATSSRREIAEEYLASARVLRYFDILVCGEEVEKGKPDPEIFLKAASELNCEPSKCFIFEDSQNGVLAASAAGAIPIYIQDIKEIDPEVKALAYRSYIKMTDFLDDFVAQMPKMPIPTLNERFPQSIDYTIAGIHGFGAIGGGFLAQIFSHWDGYTAPRLIIGATNDRLKRQLINALGKYQIRYQSLAYFQTIHNIHLIDMDDEAQIVDMYKKSHIIGLSIPEKAMRSQAKMIAKGLIERYDGGGDDLTLLIVMNKLKAAKFVRYHLDNALKPLVGPDRAKEILNRTYLSETVVDRMVSKISDAEILANAQRNLRKALSHISTYSERMKTIFESSQTYSLEEGSNVDLPSEGGEYTPTDYSTTSIADDISFTEKFAAKLYKLNVTLFVSEPDMPIYASRGSPLLERLRQVVTVESVKSMQEIKNKLSNGPHAIIAWYSALLGYKTIGQGMGDPRVSRLAESIMRNEIRPALLRENPDCRQYINSIMSNFIKRCRASFKDETSRVGRDPMRKLQWGERIVGTIQLAKKHGFETGGLEFGAACAIMYSVRSLSQRDSEATKIKELYGKRGLVFDVLTYSGDYNKTKYVGLDAERDRELIQRIQEKLDCLKKELDSTSEQK
jgi:HAD superfamily hydrolase (TIGR01509 family)